MNNPGISGMYSFKPFQFQLAKPDSTYELPVPRSGHRVVCNSKYLYVFGGYNPSIQNSLVVRDMWKFNFATRKWKQCVKNQVLPAEVTSVAAIRSRQQLLIYGGTGIPFGLTSSNQLHIIKLNEENSGFSTIETVGRSPEPMYGQAIVLHKSNLYTIGGTTGFVYTCDVHRVNLRKTRKVWKKLYPAQTNETQQNGRYVPEGRYRHEVGFDGKNIYVLGGGTSDESYSLTNIPAFNIESKTWQEIKSKGDPKNDPPYPQARKCHGVVHLKSENGGTYVYLMGGYQNCELVFNDLWRLELPTLQWTLVQNAVLPYGLYFHSTAITREGKMYAFGGIKQGLDIERTNDMYSAWMCIPKLLEICWEATLHYCQHVNLSKEMLRGLKVPEHFVARVE